MVITWRFETKEHLISKHTLSKVNWVQASKWAFLNQLPSNDWTIANIRSLDNGESIEIIKRKDVNKGWKYWLGMDQKGVYERVIINRKNETVCVDRIDINWLRDEPFMSRRDEFMPSKRHPGQMDFVRYHWWLHKMFKIQELMISHYSAWSYRRAFKGTDV